MKTLALMRNFRALFNINLTQRHSREKINGAFCYGSMTSLPHLQRTLLLNRTSKPFLAIENEPFVAAWTDKKLSAARLVMIKIIRM